MPDTGVDAWRKAQDPEGVFTSSITVGELRYGIDRLPQGRKRDALQRWYVATFTPGFGGRIFAFDPDADKHWATVRANHPEAAMIDSQIAAIAIARRLTPVTRHVRDCGFEGLSVLNPWSI